MLLAKMLLPLILAGGTSAREADPYDSALTAAVHHFAREGQLEYLRAILDKHPQLVDALEPFPPGHKPYATEGYTPLDWAASNGHEAAAKYLIRRGARVNAVVADEWTPLLLAAREGHLGVVRLLVEHGADLNVRTEAKPETSSDALPGLPGSPGPGAAEPRKIFRAIPSRTPLDWAVAMGHVKVVDYLKSLKK